MNKSSKGSISRKHIVFKTKKDDNGDLIYKFSKFERNTSRSKSRGKSRSPYRQLDSLINSKLNEELTITERVRSMLNKQVLRQVPTFDEKNAYIDSLC